MDLFCIFFVYFVCFVVSKNPRDCFKRSFPEGKLPADLHTRISERKSAQLLPWSEFVGWACFAGLYRKMQGNITIDSIGKLSAQQFSSERIGCICNPYPSEWIPSNSCWLPA